MAELPTTINIEVKLTLWNAIKLRIAGLKASMGKDETIGGENG